MNIKDRINKWVEKIWFVWNDAIAILLALVAIAFFADAIFRSFGIDPSPIGNFVRSLFS